MHRMEKKEKERNRENNRDWGGEREERGSESEKLSEKCCICNS